MRDKCDRVQVLQTPLGTFQQMQTCQTCMGTGEVRSPCGVCGGDGRVRKPKRISLTIPGGVEDGTRLRVSREGNAGRRGGPPGDLYVCVNVKDHPELRREGMTIFSDVSVRSFRHYSCSFCAFVPPHPGINHLATDILNAKSVVTIQTLLSLFEFPEVRISIWRFAWCEGSSSLMSRCSLFSPP
jgi:hypothetical protein